MQYVSSRSLLGWPPSCRLRAAGHRGRSLTGPYGSSRKQADYTGTGNGAKHQSCRTVFPRRCVLIGRALALTPLCNLTYSTRR